MSTLAKLSMGVGGAAEPGTPFEGGYYAGKIMVGSQAYALVVSPKAQGEESRQWKNTNNITNGVGSFTDGWSNTHALVNSPYGIHYAALFCRGLNINGYDDWYLPSRDELEILYRAFKPTTESNNTSAGANPRAIPPTGSYTTSNPAQTNVDVFKQGGGEAFSTGAYWSSTQSSSVDSICIYFAQGFQGVGRKTTSYLVRAVRRVAIEG